METNIVPSDTGEVSSINPINNFGFIFKLGELCRYRLIFPQTASDFDQIAVKLVKSKNVRVYATEMPDIFSREKVKDHDDFEEIIVEYPNELFITIVSANSDTQSGDFQIDYNYIDRLPEDVIPTMDEAARLAYFNKQVIVTEKEAYESVRFWVIVVATALAGTCLIGIFILFCKLRRANSSIVSDVQVIQRGSPRGMKSVNRKFNIEKHSSDSVDANFSKGGLGNQF